MSGSCLGKLAVVAALLLSAFLLLAGPTLAHASTEHARSEAGVVFGLGVADTQPAPRVTSDDRDRRVLAALAFTVIGTIGLITIGSLVLLTQPGDRQVMVVDQADPPEQSRSS